MKFKNKIDQISEIVLKQILNLIEKSVKLKIGAFENFSYYCHTKPKSTRNQYLLSSLSFKSSFELKSSGPVICSSGTVKQIATCTHSHNINHLNVQFADQCFNVIQNYIHISISFFFTNIRFRFQDGFLIIFSFFITITY